jgi:diguanylate cyclase (GGDEF)-like protein/PAS domain S-box-containing protein
MMSSSPLPSQAKQPLYARIQMLAALAIFSGLASLLGSITTIIRCKPECSGLVAAWAFAGALSMVCGTVLWRMASALAEKSIQLTESKALLDEMPDAVVVCNAQGLILQYNAPLLGMSGRHNADLTSESLQTLVSPADWQHHLDACQHTTNATTPTAVMLRQPDGSFRNFGMSMRHVPQQGQTRYIVSLHVGLPPAPPQKEPLHAAAHEAGHDFLTGLVNQRLLQNLLDHEISSSMRNDQCVAVCLCNLDDFKAINHAHGQDVGDAVLQQVAQRLSSSVRGQDIVARTAADEFVVVLVDLKGMKDVGPLAEKMLAELAQPYAANADSPIHMTASMGVSMFPLHGQTLDELLLVANGALREAKMAGKNQYVMG